MMFLIYKSRKGSPQKISSSHSKLQHLCDKISQVNLTRSRQQTYNEFIFKLTSLIKMYNLGFYLINVSNLVFSTTQRITF